MQTIFTNVLQMSFQGSIVILAVVLLRLMLKKAPRRAVCLLWLLAGLRLLVPVQIESPVSLQPDYDQAAAQEWLFPETELPLPEYEGSEGRGEILNQQGQVLVGKPLTPNHQGWGEILNQAGETIATKPLETNNQIRGEILDRNGNILVSKDLIPVTKSARQSLLHWLWLAGVGAMALYTAVSYRHLKRKVADAVILEEGVWVSARIDSPFLLGFLRPNIYLPVNLGPVEREFVLSHERVHLKRKDHLWKLLGFAALAIHWFNPLVWLGYGLLCRDLEMACDEAVVQSMDLQQRKAYSAALVSCSAKHHSLAACPVAFGEVSVKERVKNVLNYRKPGFWITLAAAIAAIFLAVFFLTSPAMTEEEVLQCLYQQIEEFQNSEEKHIVMTIDMDSEFGMVTGQRQERWTKGEDWYLHIDYETPMGSFVEGYMQLDGIQYAMDHSDEIDGFENRPWAALPKENYMSEWALQTKVFTLLEVLEIRKETGEDGGAYTIVLKDNTEPSDREKRYEATYTFRLDSKGELVGFTRYVHQDVYMSGFGKEGFFDTKSLYTFEILDFDMAEFTQKTENAWAEITQDEEVVPSNGNAMDEKAELEKLLEQKNAEREAKSVPPSLLISCQRAVEEFQSRETVCVLVENQFDGDILNDSSATEYYQNGEDWLLRTVIENADFRMVDSAMEVDGVYLERGENHYSNPAYGEDWDTGWVADVDGQPIIPWLCTVDWEKLLITDARTETQDDLTWYHLTVYGSPYEMEEEVKQYRVTFLFRGTSLSQVILEYTKTWSDGESSGHVVSTIHPNYMTAAEAEKQIEEAVKQK